MGYSRRDGQLRRLFGVVSRWNEVRQRVRVTAIKKALCKATKVAMGAHGDGHDSHATGAVVNDMIDHLVAG